MRYLAILCGVLMPLLGYAWESDKAHCSSLTGKQYVTQDSDGYALRVNIQKIEYLFTDPYHPNRNIYRVHGYLNKSNDVDIAGNGVLLENSVCVDDIDSMTNQSFIHSISLFADMGAVNPKLAIYMQTQYDHDPSLNEIFVLVVGHRYDSKLIKSVEK